LRLDLIKVSRDRLNHHSMSSLLYALNIGTLATWLTVGGASTVACVVHVAERLPALNDGLSDESELFITPQAMGSAPPAEAPEASEEEVAPEELVSVAADLPELPEMPELPELEEMEPLPEVPDLPAPVARVESTPKPSSRTTSNPSSGRPKPTVSSGRKASSGESGRGTGQGSGTARGSGSSATGSDRWVGLRKSSPNYPSSARRQGQQGTVVVQFTVDERGYVVDAKILQSCPYSVLNEEALRTVRRFRAKPGIRATTSQPIIFKLN
jgi:protein TonB